MFYVMKAPAPKVGEPLPADIPTSWGPGLMAAASVIAFAVLPAVHQQFPAVPSFDLTTVQAAIGVAVGVGLWIHQVGLQAALNYFMANMAPQLIKTLGPEIQQAVVAVIRAEMNKNGDVGALSADDVKAVKLARAVKLTEPQPNSPLVTTVTHPV
jgi:hypothetical protein